MKKAICYKLIRRMQGLPSKVILETMGKLANF